MHRVIPSPGVHTPLDLGWIPASFGQLCTGPRSCCRNKETLGRHIIKLKLLYRYKQAAGFLPGVGIQTKIIQQSEQRKVKLRVQISRQGEEQEVTRLTSITVKSSYTLMFHQTCEHEVTGSSRTEGSWWSDQVGEGGTLEADIQVHLLTKPTCWPHSWETFSRVLHLSQTFESSFPNACQLAVILQVPHPAKTSARRGRWKPSSWTCSCPAVRKTSLTSHLTVRQSTALPVTCRGHGGVQRDAHVTPTKTRNVCITVIWTSSGSTHQSRLSSARLQFCLILNEKCSQRSDGVLIWDDPFRTPYSGFFRFQFQSYVF